MRVFVFKSNQEFLLDNFGGNCYLQKKNLINSSIYQCFLRFHRGIEKENISSPPIQVGLAVG